jgi:flagellar protein FlaI
MVGYGIIDPLVRDDKLEEIMVIGPKQPVYLFHRDYEMMASNIEFYSNQEIEDLVNKIAREIGRRVDISAPLLDARLPDGSRVNATIPPASVGGGTLTIRKFRKDPYSIVDLINMNTLTPECAAFLWMAVEGMGAKPANILIAGGTGSGKTTLLNVLASFIPENERIVSVEDTAELILPLKHWIRMEARPPGIEGKGELTLDILTKNSLRMRPDRILVGEIRHDEAFTLFTAMNTGHAGSMGTVHSNSPQETIIRITNPPMSVPEVMLSGLDLIIIEHRIHDRKKGTIRRITEIAEVTGVLVGKAQTQTIFERDPVEDKVIRTNVPSNFLKQMQIFTGMTRPQVEQELTDRAALLKNLAKKNIRSMEEISAKSHEFLMKRSER